MCALIYMCEVIHTYVIHMCDVMHVCHTMCVRDVIRICDVMHMRGGHRGWRHHICAVVTRTNAWSCVWMSCVIYTNQGTPFGGVATNSRLLKIIGLFAEYRSLLKGSFAKESYNFKEPTNRSHPIVDATTYERVRGTYEWVMLCMHELWNIWMSHVKHEWVTSHHQFVRVERTSELTPCTNEWCYVWMSCGIYEWVTSNMSESRHTTSL